MKVSVHCASCLLHRGYLEARRATTDPQRQFAAVQALLKLMAKEFTPNAVPAVLGTKRDRLVREITGNPDPYLEAKRRSNKKALELLPLVRKMMSEESSDWLRFRRACLSSIAANSIEFDVLGHDFDHEQLRSLILRAEEELAIDDLDKLYRIAGEVDTILLLTDNAGEIAFDTLLVEELKRLGAEVVVAVRGGPALNDALMKDAESVGMTRVADKVIDTGVDMVGVMLEECSEEFLEVYRSADLVVAKGMANLETLTEYPFKTPHIFLLRTKCEPVARFFGVDVGRNVAKLLGPKFLKNSAYT
ncbi:hypothetical protein DRO48_02285 [Candidatus Bathyarchaeota archaeon]|nr:MAG: hypothetical protein DRO48_02285 [Candidatus Bathyarchaeota archaeon]